jgi:uncharacterized protein
MTPLIQDILTDMVDRLVAEFHPLKVYLFGSHAWGEPSADSDIDLMIVMEHLPESPTRMAQRAYHILPSRTVPVDILFRDIDSFKVWAAHPSTLEHLIERQGVVLYG